MVWFTVKKAVYIYHWQNGTKNHEKTFEFADEKMAELFLRIF